jgi:hypothetical protein
MTDGTVVEPVPIIAQVIINLAAERDAALAEAAEAKRLFEMATGRKI